jgi:hypothetical protein
VARTSVLLALEREQLGERVRLATDARDLVRRALGEQSLDLVIEACRSAVVSAFDAEGMWLSALDSAGGVSSTWHSELGQDRPPFEELGDLAIGLARLYWDDQYVAHFSRVHTVHPGLSPDRAETLVDFLDRIGIGSILFVPLGVGRECLGFLALSRVSDSPAWTTMEYEAARDIGRDLGQAVANARQRDAERAVVNRLRELDGYRAEMINTVAHELRSPLTSVVGHLELLEDEQLSNDGQRSIEAAIRGTRRLEGVIDDLPDAGQPARQRGEVLPRGLPGRGVPRSRAEPRRPQRGRPRTGDLGGGPARPLQRVLPLVQPGGVRAARHGARPGHRGPDRGPPRRAHRRRLRARAWHDRDRHAADVTRVGLTAGRRSHWLGKVWEIRGFRRPTSATVGP